MAKLKLTYQISEYKVGEKGSLTLVSKHIPHGDMIADEFCQYVKKYYSSHDQICKGCDAGKWADYIDHIDTQKSIDGGICKVDFLLTISEGYVCYTYAKAEIRNLINSLVHQAYTEAFKGRIYAEDNGDAYIPAPLPKFANNM